MNIYIVIGIVIAVSTALWFYPFVFKLAAAGDAASLRVKAYWRMRFWGEPELLIIKWQGPYKFGKKTGLPRSAKEIFAALKKTCRSLSLSKWQFYIFPFAPFYWQAECIIKARLGDIIIAGAPALAKIILMKARR
jgi:hypothetical protein